MKRNLAPAAIAGLAGFLVAIAAQAQESVTFDVNLISDKGVGKKIGTISASDTSNGFLALKFDLEPELSIGGHGLHVHENGSCEAAEQDGKMVAGLAAGGHYDPAGMGKHLGPSGDGHLGDLPILYAQVNEDGAEPIVHTLVAPRLKLADVRGRAIVIHEGSDNFRDDPKPLGGGGARVACGVVPN